MQNIALVRSRKYPYREIIARRKVLSNVTRDTKRSAEPDYHFEKHGATGELIVGERLGELLGAKNGDRVTEFMHSKLCSGRTLNGRRLVQNVGKKNRREAMDRVFSPPRSVDAIWAVADEEDRMEIEEAVRQATIKTLAITDKWTAWVRQGAQGRHFVPAEVARTLFPHGESRPVIDQFQLPGDPLIGNPNLHFHVIDYLFGLASNGKTNALETSLLLRWKMAGGSIFRVFLAFELRALGYPVVRRGGDLFEIDGVPPNVVEAWSARRKQILGKENGTKPNAKERERIAKITRRGKYLGTDADRHEIWRRQAQHLGWNFVRPQKPAKPFRYSEDDRYTLDFELQDLAGRLRYHFDGIHEEDIVEAIANTMINRYQIAGPKSFAGIIDEFTSDHLIKIGKTRFTSLFETVDNRHQIVRAEDLCKQVNSCPLPKIRQTTGQDRNAASSVVADQSTSSNPKIMHGHHTFIDSTLHPLDDVTKIICDQHVGVVRLTALPPRGDLNQTLVVDFLKNWPNPEITREFAKPTIIAVDNAELLHNDHAVWLLEIAAQLKAQIIFAAPAKNLRFHGHHSVIATLAKSLSSAPRIQHPRPSFDWLNSTVRDIADGGAVPCPKVFEEQSSIHLENGRPALLVSLARQVMSYLRSNPDRRAVILCDDPMERHLLNNLIVRMRQIQLGLKSTGFRPTSVHQRKWDWTWFSIGDPVILPVFQRETSSTLSRDFELVDFKRDIWTLRDNASSSRVEINIQDYMRKDELQIKHGYTRSISSTLDRHWDCVFVRARLDVPEEHIRLATTRHRTHCEV